MTPYYQDDWVTIYHGDCREILPIEADLCLTDPPYGVRSDLEWDDLTAYEFAAFSMSWLPLCGPPDTPLAVFGVSQGPIRDLCGMVYPRVRQIIWGKPEGSQYAGASEGKLWFAHEIILHCHDEVVEPKNRQWAEMLKKARVEVDLSRSGVDIAIRGKKTGLCFRWEEAACIPTEEQEGALKVLLGLDEAFTKALSEARLARDVVKERAAEKAAERAAEKADVLLHRTVTNPQHPCEKPIGLITDLLSTIAWDAKVILDPFMGSGTTLRAAKDLNRKAIGIELEEKYCEIAANRMSQEVFDFT